MACVSQKYKELMKWSILISCTCVNISIVVANTVSLANFFKDLLTIDAIYVKLALTFIYCIVLILTPEPEKIKALAVPAFLIVFLIFFSFLGYNLYELKDYDKSIDRELFDWNNTMVYTGIALYAYEAVATLFTVRNTMQKPQTLPKITVWSFISIGMMFILFGCSFYSVWGDHLKDSVWEKFPWSTNKYFYI